ncbi:MAG TPA: ParB/RepB/Spo0J family partition protein [Candidatus Saccharimonadia bacterium]|nr:ParB/RepB/Spo0J family partition protein [Candidatus Saccharimonadia bacterium]
MAEKRRGLGRGFDSLIPTQVVEDEFDVTAKVDESGHRVSVDAVHELHPDLLDPNPYQPREDFNQTELEALAASIRVHGILQPLVVTKTGSRYQLIAGERRLRAAKIAGLDSVPVIVRSFDEQAKLELALIENIQRSELNPLELATAYRKLSDQFNLTNTEIGNRVGRDDSTISNTMRLLNLPKEAKRALVENKIVEGHARVILSVPEPQKQVYLLDMIVRKHWTVRHAEEYARAYKGDAGSKMRAMARVAAINQLTMNLGDYLGAKVSQMRTAKGGKLIIEYYSDEELERIYKAIRREE